MGGLVMGEVVPMRVWFLLQSGDICYKDLKAKRSFQEELDYWRKWARKTLSKSTKVEATIGKKCPWLNEQDNGPLSGNDFDFEGSGACDG